MLSRAKNLGQKTMSCAITVILGEGGSVARLLTVLSWEPLPTSCVSAFLQCKQLRVHIYKHVILDCVYIVNFEE